MNHPEGENSAYLNRGLFSDDYLRHRLPERDEWKNADVSAAYRELRDLYESGKDRLGEKKEAQTESEFLEPALRILGFSFTSQPAMWAGVYPDYELFADESAKQSADATPGGSRGAYTLALLEGKRWGLSLDRGPGKQGGQKATKSGVSPEMQLVDYLRNTGISWGVLTNGSEWRLYRGDTLGKTQRYFSMTLEDALESEESFRWFYLFFNRAPGVAGSFLDTVLAESEDHAVRVGKELKDIIFTEVFPTLARGFLEYRRGKSLPVDDEALGHVYRGSLALLYRLLFLLYAEARDLLPAKDAYGYGERSMTRIRDEVAGRVEGPYTYTSSEYTLWQRLEDLFRIVDEGSPELNVPAYNGGLFKNAGSHTLLAEHRISDKHLAGVIHALSRRWDQEAGEYRNIDYGFLGVRELGSVYEGLLEFSLRVAEEELVVVKKDGKEVYKQKSSHTSGKTYGEVKAGEPYLVNDNSERKATGSYYTPRYIVDYIVQNTLGPLVAERRAALEEKLTEIRKADDSLKRARKSEEYRASARRGARPLETLLDVKVLDPAMGSGHFLVAAVDYLTDEFVGVIRELDDGPVLEQIGELRGEIEGSLRQYGVSVTDEQLSDANLLKRMVMKRCVYGVDLNEMAVELAKLSLWLDAFTVGAPLSFLDHHLKHGNSLIGSSVREVQREIESSGSLFGNQFVSTLNQGTELMRYVGEIADATEWEVKESFDAYERADRVLRPYKRMLDLWTSQHFGNARAQNFLATAASNVDVDHLIEGDYDHFEADDREIIDTALHLSGTKDFFHWELEFPEVFFDEQARHKETPGFDAVVGNPPYDVLALKELGEDLTADLLYYRSNSSFSPALGGKLNYYKLFTGSFSQRARRNGKCGLIIPMSVIGDKSALDLRKHLLYDMQLETLDCFPQKDNPKDRVFEDAKLSTSIVTWSKETPESKFRIRTHRGRYIKDSSTSSKVSYGDVQLFDPEDLNIPNLDQEELNIVLRIAQSEHISQFHRYANVIQGEINLKVDEDYISIDPGEHKIIRGSQVSRYRVSETLSQGKPLFLSKDDYLAGEKPNSKAFAFQRPRVVFQRNTGVDDSRRIHSALLQRGLFTADSLNFVSPLSSEVASEFLLAVLNSNISEWSFRLSSTNNHVNAYEIERLPMPRIEFTASEEQRAMAHEEVKEMYEKRDYNALVDCADRALAWTSESGHADDGHNHLVHDLLAYLAGQVTTSMEECDKLQRTWREWVEAAVPDAHKLTKTFRQQGWVEAGCRDGWEGVRAEFQARKAIPDSPKDLQNLRKNTEDALRELCPLRERIEATDRLIDQIVYRLYGLTEEEISVVEGSVGRS